VRLTTKGRYAVTAMLDLAIHREQGPISLADVSQRQSISLSYLEQLFARLRKGMLVKSVRGPGGGYELDETPEYIKISHIIDAVNESVDTTKCQGAGNCQGGETCLTHHLWEDLSEQIHDFLQGVSLADLVTKNEVRQVARDRDKKQSRAHSSISSDDSGLNDSRIRATAL